MNLTIPTEHVVVARDGAVRIRRPRNTGALIGFVERDGKTWRGLDLDGVRVSEGHTRAAALKGLSTHYASAQFSPTAADEHKSATGPVSIVVPEDAQRTLRPWEWVGIVVGAVAGACTLGLFAYALTLF